ncbi:TonB-dependent receptor plug domain-containing protein [Niabella hibiscisoli]|uniref:TonB-dependent receptor plug domain-containing protein n=1 Tax=Niabella hibiscisoli TaxID=1825928 RepID=UPI00293E056A|nr:TonB-dependent receptor plug domain-containing protein [Niabella hibiscisoli]
MYNVDKDMLSKGGSGSDVLNNIPSVNVDPTGVISYRGNTAVRILVNGKPSQLTANNGIGQIPASNIEKVELISNPSAQYEATGGAGIINIVLRKNKASGFNGSLQTSMGYPAHYGMNANLSYKTSRYNLFSNIGYNYRNIYFKRTRYQEFNKQESFAKLNNEALEGNNERNLLFYVGGDIYFNENNTLTGSFYYDKLQNEDTTLFLFDYFNSNHIRDSSLYRFEKYSEPQHFNELELNYVKTFKKKAPGGPLICCTISGTMTRTRLYLNEKLTPYPNSKASLLQGT